MQRRPESLLISDIIANLFLYCETCKIPSKDNEFELIIFAELGSQSQLIKLKIQEFAEGFERDFFRIMELPEKSGKKTGKVDFLVYSQSKALQFRFDSIDNSFAKRKIVYLKLERNLEIEFCARSQLFLIPQSQYLEIWDRSLSFKVHSVELPNKIEALKYIASEGLAILYDKQG